MNILSLKLKDSMKPAVIEVAMLQKKRDEIMSESSAAKLKQLEWVSFTLNKDESF
jgi:hypothetical protein